MNACDLYNSHTNSRVHIYCSNFVHLYLRRSVFIGQQPFKYRTSRRLSFQSQSDQSVSRNFVASHPIQFVHTSENSLHRLMVCGPLHLTFSCLFFHGRIPSHYLHQNENRILYHHMMLNESSFQLYQSKYFYICFCID